MYHRGGDRGWHQPPERNYHHPQDVHPVPILRGHHNGPYRGECNVPRGHGSGEYHDYHDNPCHDRMYMENQFPYHTNDRSYHEYMDPGYNKGASHDSDYRNGSYYRGGHSQQGRGVTSHYRRKSSESYKKKRPSKSPKTPSKERQNSGKATTPIAKTTPPVIHNPARTVVVLTSGESSGDEKANETVTPEANGKTSTKPSCDLKTEKPIEESKTLVCEMKPERTESSGVSTEPECDIKTKPGTDTPEGVPPAPQTPKQDEVTEGISAGKRPHSEEKGIGMKDSREGARCAGKRARSDLTESSTEGAVQIPLLGALTDISSETPTTREPEPAGTGLKADDTATARALRTAFILARKEEIELAYAQDCQTFALVASTLLKQDPSIEAAVAGALRTSLEEIAGKCVQELRHFIDQYDIESSKLPFLNIASRAQHIEK
ncbi:uncharacterized protein O3C94_001843 isoform 1-T1 [Discoglossus pictus]